MNLYIEVENGQVKNHPAFEDNLLQAFGAIPNHWETFVRVSRPVLDAYQLLVNQDPIYAKVNDVWTDVWTIREMTAEEKIAKQQLVKTEWSELPNRENYTAWVFNEVTCKYEPPIPKPNGLHYWDGATNSWLLQT